MKSITSAIPPSVIQIFLLLSKDDPSSLFKPPLMDGETMALEAVGSACPHGGVLHRREVASQAIAVGDVPTLRRKSNHGRIGLQGFMVEVIETGLDFIGNLTDEVGIGEMAVDAGELLVGGCLPSGVNEIHAVAGSAHPGTARGLIPADQDGHEDYAGNDAGGQQLRGREAQQVVPVHASVPFLFMG